MTAERAEADTIELAPALRETLAATVVIIPVLNEEASIGKVLADLPAVRQVIVADNGSTDRSVEVARRAGATVVHESERGYGAACLAGIAEIDRQIRAGSPAPAVVLFIDGDYSDHPEEATTLLAPLAAGEADLVIGSRMLGRRESGAMPFQAAFGNRLASWLMWLFWGARFTDLGPFRAITFPSLQQLQMQDRNFGWTVEMQIKAVQCGLRRCEVPVSYRRRVGVSKISGTVSGTVRAGWKILFTLFRYRFLPPRNHPGIRRR